MPKTTIFLSLLFLLFICSCAEGQAVLGFEDEDTSTGSNNNGTDTGDTTTSDTGDTTTPDTGDTTTPDTGDTTTPDTGDTTTPDTGDTGDTTPDTGDTTPDTGDTTPDTGDTGPIDTTGALSITMIENEKVQLTAGTLYSLDVTGCHGKQGGLTGNGTVNLNSSSITINNWGEINFGSTNPSIMEVISVTGSLEIHCW